MQLDRTRIAIHERGVLDTMDLALRLVRVYAWPLFVLLLLGAMPFVVLNQILIGWMLQWDAGEAYLEEALQVWRYIWVMIVLVVIEAPLVTSFITSFLGQVVFLERPRLRELVGDVWKAGGPLIWCHLIGRGVLPALLLVAVIDRDSPFSGAELWLILLLIAVCLRRGLRPFINEIVLLERSPLRSEDPTAITISKRSVMLHGPSGGDLLIRWFVSAMFNFVAFGFLLGTLVCLQGIFLDDWTPGRWFFQIGPALSLWLIAGYTAVVRFLTYLDLRIRQEGWEVELRLRAEASRLTGVRA
jgi:hypothetical protein